MCDEMWMSDRALAMRFREKGDGYSRGLSSSAFGRVLDECGKIRWVSLSHWASRIEMEQDEGCLSLKKMCETPLFPIPIVRVSSGLGERSV